MMFYCEECRIKHNYPGAVGWPTIGMSYGKCEICGKLAECHDVSSDSLSSPKHRRERVGRDRCSGMSLPKVAQKHISRAAREAMREQILRCSEKAPQKRAANLKSGAKKPTVVALAELIAGEFEGLNG
jgi:hypothetical protein